jgi:hypothetical protein
MGIAVVGSIVLVIVVVVDVSLVAVFDDCCRSEAPLVANARYCCCCNGDILLPAMKARLLFLASDDNANIAPINSIAAEANIAFLLILFVDAIVFLTPVYFLFDFLLLSMEYIRGLLMLFYVSIACNPTRLPLTIKVKK